MNTTKVAAPRFGATFTLSRRTLRFCTTHLNLFSLAISAPFALIACGGGGGGSAVTPTATYSVTATVSGLSGSGLSLATDTGTLNVTSNGSVTLESNLASGTAYSVSINTQPVGPVQTCSLTGSTGKVSTSNATVTVSCVAGNSKTVNAAKSTVAIDSAIPASTQAAIAHIISSIDSQPLQASLLIPVSFVGGETLVLAVDANNNILLATLTTNASVSLSAGSTALALTRMALGALPSTLTAATLNTEIEATADFPTLESAVLSSLSAGNSLIATPAVAQAIFKVVSEIPAQNLSAFTSVERGAVHIKASPVTQPSLPNAPYDLLSISTNPHILGALTVAGATSAGGVTVVNTTPLVWTLSSTDTTNQVLCAPGAAVSSANPTCAVTMDSTSLADLLQENLGLNIFEPSNSPIGGNGAAFNIKAYQGVTSTTANIIQIDEDVISVLASLATAGEDSPACIDQAAASLFPPAGIATIAVQLTNGGLAGAAPAINAYLKSVFSLKNALTLFNAVIGCSAAIDGASGKSTFFGSFAAAYTGFVGYLTGAGTANAADFTNSGGLVSHLYYTIAFSGYSKTFGVCEIHTGQTYTVSDCTASLSFSPGSVTLVPGSHYMLAPQALDINGGATLSPNDLTYTSSQAPSIITLDAQTGLVIVQAIAGGATTDSATVTATSNATGISASYTINVNSLPTLTITAAPPSVPATGGAVTFTVTVAPPAGAVNPPSFTGTVTVSDLNSGVLCQQVALTNGVGTCTPSAQITPPDTIRANFMNDTFYAPASASMTVTSSGAPHNLIARGINSSGDIVGWVCPSGTTPTGQSGCQVSGVPSAVATLSGQQYQLGTVADLTPCGFDLSQGTIAVAESENGSILIEGNRPAQPGYLPAEASCLLTRVGTTVNGTPQFTAAPLGSPQLGINSGGDIVGWVCPSGTTPTGQSGCQVSGVPSAVATLSGQQYQLGTVADLTPCGFDLSQGTIAVAESENGSILIEGNRPAQPGYLPAEASCLLTRVGTTVNGTPQFTAAPL